MQISKTYSSGAIMIICCIIYKIYIYIYFLGQPIYLQKNLFKDIGLQF